MPRIIVKVRKGGETTIATEGFGGEKCRDASKFLEKMGQKVSDTVTSDFYVNPAPQAIIHIENGNGEGNN
jgi:hypothetical protein